MPLVRHGSDGVPVDAQDFFRSYRLTPSWFISDCAFQAFLIQAKPVADGGCHLVKTGEIVLVLPDFYFELSSDPAFKTIAGRWNQEQKTAEVRQ